MKLRKIFIRKEHPGGIKNQDTFIGIIKVWIY